MPADPKQGRRIIDKKAVERKMMDELQCRACGPNGTGRLEAHHLVNRSQLGDDVEANIVALCPVCHFTFTHEGGNSARVVARRIRSNLSQSERGYIIRKKSFEWLEQHYPRFEASDRTGWPVLSEGEAKSDAAPSGPDGAAAVSPSESTPGSAEPRNREVREGHPSVLVSSADKPGGVEQPEMAAPPSGAGLPSRVIAGTGSQMVTVHKIGIPTETPYWLEPGVDCPTCHRRVPHEKKKTSPTSAVHSFRGPTDEKDSTKEIIEAAAQHTGVGTERPFWKHEWAIRSAADQLAGPPGTLARKP